MQSIEKIMKLRKGYAIKLYEHFNHIQKKLDEQLNLIYAESQKIYAHEEHIWEKLQDKKVTLEKFEHEIEILSKSKGVLDKKRLLEVKTLREKLQLKLNESNNEYSKFIQNTQYRQEQWVSELKNFLLSSASNEKLLAKIHQAVSATFPELKEYCANWKNEPITRLKTIISNAHHIENNCKFVLSEIQSISSLNMDQQHLANQKTSQIPKSCEAISKELDSFITNLDYLDILNKTKDVDPFVEEFFSIFKDSGFTSLRTSIRMVNNTATTEKKLITIYEKFQHIQIIFNQVLDKLNVKKYELMNICTDAEAFADNTCSKWLNTQYQAVLNISEQIHQKRNEFVVNETIL